MRGKLVKEVRKEARDIISTSHPINPNTGEVYTVRSLARRIRRRYNRAK